MHFRKQCPCWNILFFSNSGISYLFNKVKPRKISKEKYKTQFYRNIVIVFIKVYVDIGCKKMLYWAIS